jgi:DNA-binding HxlR family transcriptional regulator
VARTLEIVGEKWALLAVREASMGNHRFDEMVRCTGAPRDTLAARLRTLVAAGILERRQYSEHPARFEYHLTEAGRDLRPVLMTMIAWGDRHLAGAEGPPVLWEHQGDHKFVAKVVCEHCGAAPGRGELRPVLPDRPHVVRDPAPG